MLQPTLKIEISLDMRIRRERMTNIQTFPGEHYETDETYAVQN
jgi:hypothetical protein